MPDRDAGGPEHRPDRLAARATPQISEYGFVTTPVPRRQGRQLTDEIVHLDATEEQERLIAQANEPLDANGKLTGDSILCRTQAGQYVYVDAGARST